MRELVSQ